MALTRIQIIPAQDDRSLCSRLPEKLQSRIQTLLATITASRSTLGYRY
ncbi:uncharacterized protein ANIA_11506 [Aspergillus nidulans FGSC A4]|uniref:Uncharacterized protein n=1 Tax=Emericella nidulans (strain FGSC A4 / ATCC 38163 / CBS 112.46 / NRRL 194 / M139) TaxID=227321 RepID=C8V1J6_EMENI|nr:hypothetical protein [Aspergillus nidulans FGSC A4]CBF69859.1 TPA: hypothetical protein ANIA_11506 [Aspergillus nidulans FGSC A4]